FTNPGPDSSVAAITSSRSFSVIEPATSRGGRPSFLANDKATLDWKSAWSERRTKGSAPATSPGNAAAIASDTASATATARDRTEPCTRVILEPSTRYLHTTAVQRTQSPRTPGLTTHPSHRTIAGVQRRVPTHQYHPWMRQAIELARTRVPPSDDPPVGALVYDHDSRLLGQGYHDRPGTGDPTAYAELTALRQAADAVGGWRLDGCTVVTT